MKEYLREREAREMRAKVTGIILTLAIHAGALATVSFTGIKYIYPPPPESTFLLEFEEEQTPIIEQKKGREPQAEAVDREKPVELVQKSKSPEVAKRENLTPETKQDDFGDVDTAKPEVKEEPKLDPRAAFPGMAKKDTTLTAPHSASESSATFKAGHAEGNTNKGAVAGTPNAHVQGRNVVGNVPRPSYSTQESGKVVVTIWVDQYGNVQKAVAGADGTTVTDKTLWAAARNAALKTHFNMNADAPAMQEGTITYIFNLK